MKKSIAIMAIAAIGLMGCQDSSKPLEINNSLTAEEIAAGRFTPEIMWKMGRVGNETLSPDGKTLVYTTTYYNLAENRGVTAIYAMGEDGKPTQLTTHEATSTSPQWSADGQTIYFLSNRSGSMQIWSMNADGSKQKQVSEADKDIEGFGVAASGKVWYAKRVLVKPIKSSDVYPDCDKSNARVYDDLMVRHWDYWDEGSYMHIFVGEVDDNKIDDSKSIDIIGADSAFDAPMGAYFDMKEISWNNAGTQLAYTCKKMTGTEYALSTDSDIYLYDVASASTKNICKESVGEANSMLGYDKYPTFSPDDKKIAFRSMETPGYESDKERLFVWNSEDNTLSYVTSSFDNNATCLTWDGNETIYFVSPIEATHQVCRTDLGGNVQVLTQGDHDINSFTKSGDRIVGNMCKITMAAELFDINPTNGELTQLTFTNKEVYDNIKMGEVQKRWVTTTDGKKMLTWVILPPNFDPNKKYPTLLYCQGGPQSVVSQFWSYRWNFQLMAAKDYIIVAPNRRGLPSFGQEWLTQISGDYSGQNIRDYLSAIDDVAKEPWSDENRLGAVGASYGGYSVYYLAGCHQNRFKALVAHCGIFNFESMYGETEELFFINHDYGGAYWDKFNQTAVRSYEHSPHKFVDNWTAPILILTGEYDFRIPYTQSLQAFTAARLHGIPARLVDFQDESHIVTKPQNSIVWNREFFAWLDKYLKE